MHNRATTINNYLVVFISFLKELRVPCGRKRKRHKIATHKRKKKLRKNRHKKK